MALKLTDLSQAIDRAIRNRFAVIFSATNIDTDQKAALLASIKTGYNTMDGFYFHPYEEADAHIQLLKNEIKTPLDRFRKLTPEEYMKLNEAIRTTLTFCAKEFTTDALHSSVQGFINQPVSDTPSSQGLLSTVVSIFSRTNNSRPSSNYAFDSSDNPVATPWYYYSPINVIFMNHGSSSHTYSTDSRSTEKKERDVFDAIVAIFAFLAIIGGGVVSAYYAVQKACKSIGHLINGNKIIRSFARLTGFYAGAYVGVTTGMMAGAALGIAIPGVGSLIGSIIGGIFGGGLGAGLGTAFTKYLAQFVSWMSTGQTNPEKWTLSTKEEEHLLTLGFDQDAIDEIQKLITGIKEHKQDLSVTSNTQARDKAKFNSLLKMLRHGEVTGPFKLGETLYSIEQRIPAIIGTIETIDDNRSTTTKTRDYNRSTTKTCEVLNIPISATAPTTGNHVPVSDAATTDPDQISEMNKSIPQPPPYQVVCGNSSR